MPRLMPQGSFRWCLTPSCARRWYTATPVAQPCPFCGAMTKDATDGWPHICSRGHGAKHDGNCLTCIQEGR